MAAYGGGAADVGYRADLVVAGHAFEVWDAASGGARVVDLFDHTGASAELARTDDHGRLRFTAPEHTGDLYVIDAGAPQGAPRTRILPADLVPRLTGAEQAAASALAAAPDPGAVSDLQTRVAEAEAQAARVPGLDDRIGAVEQTVSGFEDVGGRLAMVENDALPGLGTRVETLENTTIPALDSRLGTLEQAPALEQGGGADPELVARVEALESAVAPVPSLGARLDGVEAVAVDLTSRLETLEAAPPSGGGNGGGGGLMVVTSASRPAGTPGTMIYETDTGHTWIYATSGSWSGWVPLPGTLVYDASTSTSQSMASGANTTLTLENITVNLLGSAGTDRFRPLVPGLYVFSGAVSFAPNTSGNRNGMWLLNGGNVVGGMAAGAASNPGQVALPLRTMGIRMNGTNDYVQLVASHFAGTTLSSSTSMAYRPSMSVLYAGV